MSYASRHLFFSKGVAVAALGKEGIIEEEREGRILFNDTMVLSIDIRCHERHHLSDHL